VQDVEEVLGDRGGADFGDGARSRLRLAQTVDLDPARRGSGRPDPPAVTRCRRTAPLPSMSTRAERTASDGNPTSADRNRATSLCATKAVTGKTTVAATWLTMIAVLTPPKRDPPPPADAC
jgi:hypothetical protein